jgi:predicted DNA-binding ribbon-helix-helix protein
MVRMHTTTVRFAADTWRELKDVCERDGIPVAQFLREAAIARLAGRVYREELDALSRRVAVLERRARVDQERRYGRRLRQVREDA